MPLEVCGELPAKSIDDLACLRIDRHRRLQGDDLAARNIEPALAHEGAGLELADRRARRLLGAADDLVRQLLDVGQAIAPAHADQPFAGGLAARHLGGEVAENRVGRAHVRADHRMQDLARLAAPVELERRNPQALLVHVAGAGADAVAADIGMVDGRADEGDRLVAVEDRRQHGDVEEMPGRQPRVVGHQNVARLDAVVEPAHQMGAGDRQRIDVAGCAGIGLRHHAPAPVEQRAGEVAGLAHHRAERDALQRLGPLADDADQVRPEDFELDRVHGSIRLFSFSLLYLAMIQPI